MMFLELGFYQGKHRRETSTYVKKGTGPLLSQRPSIPRR